MVPLLLVEEISEAVRTQRLKLTLGRAVAQGRSPLQSGKFPGGSRNIDPVRSPLDQWMTRIKGLWS